jgi:transketolase
MRKTCLNKIYELAKRDKRVVFIGSDLSPGLLDEMKSEMPDRHYMEGVMEMNVVGMAAGMALDGLIPYVNTIATFITRRCYEQVALDLCLHDLPVRLVGNGGGLVYAPLGPTHLAIEDIAIMRSLPNMTVTAVCDADEMGRLMEASLDWPHPIYIRLGKGGDPVVSREENGFSIGKAIPLRVAETNDNVLLISTGVLTSRALESAAALSSKGIECSVLHIHTIKPIDERAIVEHASKSRLVVTIEEHTIIGGLGSAVTDVLVERCAPRMPRILRLGIPDVFSKHYGVQDDLLEIYGLQPHQITEAVEKATQSLAVA